MIPLRIAGTVVVLIAATDLFLTVFNYDGYAFLSIRYQRALWRLIRLVVVPCPRRLKHTLLSLGSASLLPATVALWLGLQIAGFALIIEPGLAHHEFTLENVDPGFGSAFYLSAGAISSLSFGDVVATAGIERAALDLETIFGLATFTLGLGYVVASFGVLGELEKLHGIVHRQAEHPSRPSSIVARHFHGGPPDDLPSFFESLGEHVETYDQGLRRYPVIYYVHTRRRSRSIPHIFTTLGDLITLVRWGLPESEPIRNDAFLMALVDSYADTLDRLRTSFAGPQPIRVPEPMPSELFASAYASDDGGGDPWVRGFKVLEQRARLAAGIDDSSVAEDAYARYSVWLPFGVKQWAILDRVADTLAYSRPTPIGRPPNVGAQPPSEVIDEDA